MADSTYNVVVSELANGINIDVDPTDQPKGSRRYTLNTVEKSTDGHIHLANEPSNDRKGKFPMGFVPLGDRYMNKGETVVILVDPINNKQEIGIVGSDGEYTTFVDTGILGLSIECQVDIRFRVRRGDERVIYWVDGCNNARSVNLDRLHDYYNDNYKEFLKTGQPPANWGTAEKWDVLSFNLVRTYTLIPTFNTVELLDYGSIEPGSYNFAIQYVDDDLNPTEWILTSNTVNIFNDSLDNTYERIRGSRNVNTSAQAFPRASKTIKLTLGNMDESFPFYRVAIIRASGGTGEPDKAFASEIQSTSNGVFTYAGNDASLTEIPIQDIILGKQVIYKPKHLEQQENIMILLNTEGKGINWCNYQKFASKISSKLNTRPIILNTVFDDSNVKNPNSTFKSRGYMPGEVYSFGIVYVFKDGYTSPVFHIPGVNESQIIDRTNPNAMLTSTNMLYHELPNNTYLDIHNCSTNNYWGIDATNKQLVEERVRHHRFPFRHQVNEPLVTRSTTGTTINKYKLTVNFTLKAGQTYPLDIDNEPMPIDYNTIFQIHDAIGTSDKPGTLIESDVTNGRNIEVYDGTVPLDNYAIDPTCDLMVTYSTVFDVNYTYGPYPVTTTINTDTSKIFGIRFSNIENPDPANIEGFYIVRNDRTDDDRIVVDTGLFGNIIEHKDYRSFGLLAPKQFYPVNNCGETGPDRPADDVKFSTESMWFFNPEYEYLQKKMNFSNLEIEGRYEETGYDMPTITNMDLTDPNYGCNSAGTKGVYIEDVQAGTTYDPERNKDKYEDDDGFDLVIGYRNTEFDFQLNNTGLTAPESEKNLYLTAAAYQDYNGKTYYNVSVDNKIGMFLPKTPISPTLLRDTAGATGGQTKLVYAAMVRDNIISYSNFINRIYYKEHNNLIEFPPNISVINNFDVFNGDVQISSSSIVSSVYYDMVAGSFPKKNRVWKIVVGAVLVATSIVLIATGVGAGLGVIAGVSAISALTSTAISIGISLITSGINFQQFQGMAQTDYAKGLKETIVDGGVWETVRNGGKDEPLEGKDEDDTIRWFADRLNSLYMETTIPIGIRTGVTAGVTDFMDSPSQYDEQLYRTYLTEKLTSLDSEQGSGRLYRGFASAEVYDINLDYMRHNHEKLYIHLPLEYDCCTDHHEKYPRRVHWSEQSFQEEKIDNYRSFLPNNYCDIEGEHGEITGVYRLGNSLFIQTVEGTWQLPQNKQERVTSEVVSFIGTGTLFSILPKKVIDDDMGSLGTQHKWGNLKTMIGMFSISEPENKIFLHSDKIKEVSADGIKVFADENIRSFLGQQMFLLYNVIFPNGNNPVNPSGTGYISTYDNRFNRAIFTKRDYLLLPEKIADLTLVSEIPVQGSTDFVYNTNTGVFYQGDDVVPLTNKEYFEDKSFTVSFSLNTAKWVSWHSYIPYFYLHSKGKMFSWMHGEANNHYWIHNMEGSYQKFYDTRYPHIIEGVLSTPGIENIFDDITIQTKALFYNSTNRQYVERRHITFNKINVYNSLQNSGELYMAVKQENPNKQDWFNQQTKRMIGQIVISRENNGWNINNFRDFIINYNTPMFTSDWFNIQSVYPIDKVITPLVTSFAKDWRFLESFRGKYIVFRLKFDNFDDINLITNYLLSTTNLSN